MSRERLQILEFGRSFDRQRRMTHAARKRENVDEGALPRTGREAF
jgi:hypothetical protein